MTSERASELHYDTASTLRLLDAELGELVPREAAPAISGALRTGAKSPSTSRVPESVLEKTMTEVHAILTSLRAGRAHLRQAASDHLTRTSEKLDEVNSATAIAALDIMDTLERAAARVDELDQEDVQADPTRGAAIRQDLRDDLFGIMGRMQFQDITTQQIMHVQSQLAEMEARLEDVASLFEPTENGSTRPLSPLPTGDASTFDPNATLLDAEGRQALADSLTNRPPA